MNDWLDSFVEATSNLSTPEIFRRWTGISLIAGCLQRRVYTSTRFTNPLYPNLYITLVSDSDNGKTTIIEAAQSLFTELKKITIISDINLTQVTFFDILYKNPSLVLIIPDTSYHTYNRFSEDLSCIFDNPEVYVPRVSPLLRINKPNLNYLASTNNRISFHRAAIPYPNLMGRTIFIYSKQSNISQNLPSKSYNISYVDNNLLPTLESFTNLTGEFIWDPAAIGESHSFLIEGHSSCLQNPLLKDYKAHRTLFLIKLSMISAVSSTGGLIVSVEDCLRARAWLLEAEGVMHNIFY